ncbi:hypothetical protein PNOK_0334600 [Pyrrhoderma noxium]|uniref:Uncharacterized protein n=1 Tax=Pyrrhoderma noxium TaxID=2282107 RepID=A0A286UME9_9AGAM|nr:hypothetical protein PNOK_0334600 [Pyrrhoderma noxium]
MATYARSLALITKTTTRLRALSKLSFQTTSNDPKHQDGLNETSDERARDQGHQQQQQNQRQERSAHAQWYADIVPAMIPVALLGSAVYLGLKLIQTNLSTEKYLDEANARIKQLEKEVAELLAAQQAQTQSTVLTPQSQKVLPNSVNSSSSSKWWKLF